VNGCEAACDAVPFTTWTAAAADGDITRGIVAARRRVRPRSREVPDQLRQGA
jgi:hypothetical protein